MKILVVCVRYLGDTLLLRPCLRALHTTFPEAKISAIVSAGTACALDDCPHVERVIEWPKRGFAAQLVALVKLGNYDWAVDFTGNDRSALIALATRARLRVAYERPKLPKWSLRRAAYNLRPPHHKHKPHTLIQRLELLQACGVEPQGTEIGLAPRPAVVEAMQRRLVGMPARILHAHVTSRDMQKALPAPLVGSVLEAAMNAGMGVVVTGGSSAAERKHVAEAAHGLPTESLKIFHDLGWHELVATISLCSAYWGCDTAPAHIAAAFAKPMLLHFGPSRADHWAPLHSAATNDVRECACLKSKSNTCPKGRPGRCMENITPNEVARWLGPVK